MPYAIGKCLPRPAERRYTVDMSSRLALRCVLTPALLALFVGCSREAPQPQTFDPVAECPRLLADSTLPADAAEAERQREAGRAWSDREARAVYVCRARAIAAADAGWRAEGLDAEARARRAYAIRHEARLTGRAMMRNRAEVAALRARDAAAYGSRDGPSWQWLVERGREKGLRGDALYESIREGAAQTNDVVDAHLGL